MLALQKAVSGNVLFSNLEIEELTDVLDAMFLVVKKPKDIVMEQGDEGDNFYIISEGQVEVCIFIYFGFTFFVFSHTVINPPSFSQISLRFGLKRMKSRSLRSFLS